MNFNDVDKEFITNQTNKSLKTTRYYWFGYLAIVREVNLACFGILIVAANCHKTKLIVHFKSTDDGANYRKQFCCFGNCITSHHVFALK